MRFFDFFLVIFFWNKLRTRIGNAFLVLRDLSLFMTEQGAFVAIFCPTQRMESKIYIHIYVLGIC